MKKNYLTIGITVLIIGIVLAFFFIPTKEKVIVYASMEENQIQDLKKKVKEEFPDLKVIIQYISTGNCAAKIKTEGENIEADIIVDLETAHIKNLENNFADISNYDRSIYLDGLVTSNNYVPWVKYTMSLLIDKKYFEENNLEIPKTYEDLLNPEYKNLIAMPDPKTSGTGYAFFLNTVNIMGRDNAVEYFKKLKENIREFTASGSGPSNLLKQGEIAIAMGMTSQGSVAITEGYDFEIHSLETGAPYNTTSMGIIKGKENNENVKKVFEWLITDYSRYHKENFMPDVILKDQKNNVKNYPTDFKQADMTGIDDVGTKEQLIKIWGEING